MGIVIDVLVIVFVVTQVVYLVVNALVAVTLYTRASRLVTEREPAADETVHVLVPVYRERRDLVEQTLRNLYLSTYPSRQIETYLIYEADDPVTRDYVDELSVTAYDEGWQVFTHAVDREALTAHVYGQEWAFDETRLPRTKAAALTYAFITLSFEANDVITVFDADTQVPPDLLSRAVAGLETYDIVQAKQTVRNIDDGWLPLLESMGIAAWSHVIYARTVAGPYQLLGKGYFTRAEVLHDLGEWDVEALTEDMALGIDASGAGYRLGIVDRYVQDICPTSFPIWIRQKQRWVTGPYSHLLDSRLSVLDRVRFGTYTLANQLVSVTNVLGVPAGLGMLLAVGLGIAPPFGPVLTGIVLLNLVGWMYYTARTYAATHRAVHFESRRQMVNYYLLSNPLTQLGYATLWTVPIFLAMGRTIAGGKRGDFVVTPK